MSWRVYTDGACLGNHKSSAERRAGYGVFITDGDKTWTLSEPLDDGQEMTNNRGELMAVICALESLSRRGETPVPLTAPLTLFSDSTYVVNTITVWMRGWRASGFMVNKHTARPNADLLRRLDAAVERVGSRVTYQWMRAHQKAPARESLAYANWYGNTMADALANAACGDRSSLHKLQEAKRV